MAEKEIALSIDNVSKNFLLPHEKSTSIKSSVVNIFKKKDRSVEVQHALKDVSFQIEKGEFFGILGRNGSGKSTLLKILAEIYQPTTGKVSRVGKLVPFIELGVGFNPELTGRENVFLNGALLGFSRKEIAARYDDIVKFAELEEFMDQKLKNYSSGMQVRLAFSVATRAEADILLIDEVLAVGDADFQRKCFNYFKSLKKRGTTVVFVSHDMSAVRTFCDRAVLIEKSELVAEGKSDDIATQYSKMFIESSEEDEEPEEDLSDLKGSGKRFGNGKVKFSAPKIEKNVLSDDDASLVISTTVTVKHDIDDMVVGFSVEDAAGEQICGTNTQIKGLSFRNLKAGEEKKITWTCPNIFADGTHAIALAAHSADGVSFYDWWENATRFKVKKTEKTAFKITPKIDVNVE